MGSILIPLPNDKIIDLFDFTFNIIYKSIQCNFCRLNKHFNFLFESDFDIA